MSDQEFSTKTAESRNGSYRVGVFQNYVALSGRHGPYRLADKLTPHQAIVLAEALKAAAEECKNKAEAD